MVQKTLFAVSPKRRIQYRQVLWITIFWTLAGLLLALYKSVVYEPISDTFILQAPKGLPLLSFVLINMLGPMVGGIFGGSVIVFISKDRLRSKSYAQFILITCVMFLLIIFTINTAVSFIFYYKEELALSGAAFFIQSVKLFVTDPYALRNLVTWLAITVITLFVLQVSDKYGPGNLMRFIRGKYYRPREEERIFMMVDMNASTGIAEKLGHVQFFSLLKQFFEDITDSITNAKGEIYQYVGDEVIVSWTTAKGLPKANCIRCFFDMEEAIKKRSPFYLEKYGFLPEFKAGLHIGRATVGEIGVIRKDIAYLGDVLNATSRILGLCTTYHEKLLISMNLYQRLDCTGAGLTFKELDTVQLRGKETRVTLVAVNRMDPVQDEGKVVPAAQLPSI